MAPIEPPKYSEENPPNFLQMSGIIFDNVASWVTFGLGVAGFGALIGRAVESVKLRESARRAKLRDEILEAELEEEQKKSEEKKAAKENKKKALANAKLKKLEGNEGKVRKREVMWERGYWTWE